VLGQRRAEKKIGFYARGLRNVRNELDILSFEDEPEMSRYPEGM